MDVLQDDLELPPPASQIQGCPPGRIPPAERASALPLRLSGNPVGDAADEDEWDERAEPAVTTILVRPLSLEEAGIARP